MQIILSLSRLLLGQDRRSESSLRPGRVISKSMVARPQPPFRTPRMQPPCSVETRGVRELLASGTARAGSAHGVQMFAWLDRVLPGSRLVCGKGIPLPAARRTTYDGTTGARSKVYLALRCRDRQAAPSARDHDEAWCRSIVGGSSLRTRQNA